MHAPKPEDSGVVDRIKRALFKRPEFPDPPVGGGSNEAPTRQNGYGFVPLAEVGFSLRETVDGPLERRLTARVEYEERAIERVYHYERMTESADEIGRREFGYLDGERVWERQLEPARPVEGDGWYVRVLYRDEGGRTIPPVMTFDDYVAYDAYKNANERLTDLFEANMELHNSGVLDDEWTRATGRHEQPAMIEE